VLELRPKCLLLSDQVVDVRQRGTVGIVGHFWSSSTSPSVPD
jgi:hypothetical protein